MSAKSALLGACLGAAVTAAITCVYSWARKSETKNEEEIEEDRVLFFPVAGETPCQATLLGNTCRRRACCHNHSPDQPLAVLLAALRSAQHTLDVAVYTFSFSFLKDEVLAAARRGARVRVLTDAEQVNAGGCAVAELLRAGIQVRKGPDDFYLHHKFAIVDSKSLINGSLNWSRAAVMGNNENLLISQRRHLIKSFQNEFDRMWSQFDPSKKLEA